MKLCNVLFCVVCMASCGDDIRTLERRAKYMADSIFQYEYSVIVKSHDSICTIKMGMNMQNKLDSIVEIRKMEILKLQQGL
jgi:hypothetical protein